MNRIKITIKYSEIKSIVCSIRLFLFVMFSTIFIIACSQDTMILTVTHRQELKGIPSASGIVKVEDTLFVIGDNSVWLYELNAQFETVDRHLLMEGVTDSIVPKISKPDFEAMTSLGEDNAKELLIFGSGSKEPERNTMIKFQLKNGNKVNVYDLTTLYDAIKSSTSINAATLNIEGATTVGDRLFLFNRETNMVLEFSLEAFLNYLDTNGTIPKLKTYQLQLPKLQGLQVKVSGATTVPDTNQILITASIEDSPNTYDDGEVLGSYVGLISLDQLKDDYQPTCVLLEEGNQLLKVKVESLEIVQMMNDRHCQIVLVTDSDGGASELILAELNW